MNEQALDLRRSGRIVRRRKAIVFVLAALGLLAGAGYTVVRPPMVASEALVVLPTSVHDMATQVVIAGSDPVLSAALRKADSAVSLQTLRNRIQVRKVTFNVLSISAQGKTAAQAEDTANAVTESYIAYVGSANGPGEPVQAKVLQPAVNATGTSLPMRLLVTAGPGVLLGVLAGVIVALAVGRSDRRLRERDEIADSIGIPVLASLTVRQPSDAAGWTRLLEDYEAGAVDAWRLRKALHHLGLADVRAGNDASLTVLSLSSDRKALALGPQLAVFAASLGISTALVIGPQQDANVTATLRAACAAPSKQSRNLRVTVSDPANADQLPPTALTVVVAVVNGHAPQVTETMRTTATVLGVSAGATTAEQLARVAANAAADGRHIDGILVADPDQADHTTGRVPQLGRATRLVEPTRLTGMTETRW